MKLLWQPRAFGWFVVGLLALTLAACTVPIVTSSPPAATATASPVAVAPTAAATPTAAPSPRATASGETASDGALPVGFTDEGYPYRGFPDAPVTLEEFSDFQCPFCLRHFQQTEPLLRETYLATGQVKHIYRDFPLDSIHPQARDAAIYARCAGRQSAEAFWALHDKLFAAQNEWSGNTAATDIFIRYASELNLDVEALVACVAEDGEALSAAIDADLQEGAERGVEGTPGFFVTNGWFINGAHPFARFQEAIEAALAGQSPAPTPTLSPAQANPWAPDPARPGQNYNGTYYVGSPDAAYTIIEVSDFQCPYCLTHVQGPWLALEANYVETGKVRFVFAHLLGHTHSLKAAEAAECAGLQGKFWPMHDQLFATTDEWWPTQNPLPFFKEYAADLELDTEAFNTCMDAGQTTQAVLALHNLLLSGGVRATPSFIIVETMQLLQGSPPYEQWQGFLDELLGS